MHPSTIVQGRSTARPFTRPSAVGRGCLSAAVAATLALLLAGCSSESGEKEAAVPVQVVSVKKTSIQRLITAEAVLYPLQQAAVAPKESAPVKKFYVKRGSRVHRGELLGVLGNGDLRGGGGGPKGS